MFLFLAHEPLGIGAAVRGLIQAHPLTALAFILVAAFAVINAAVQAMEPPTEHNGPGYRYLYRFAHLLAFNFQYALRAKFPQYIPPQGAEKGQA